LIFRDIYTPFGSTKDEGEYGKMARK